MPQAKRASKQKRRSKAVPVLGLAGVSLAMAGGGASASAVATADIPPPNLSPLTITLGEEEISDVSLSTFYVFDTENTKSLGAKEARGCRAGDAVGAAAGVAAAVAAAVSRGAPAASARLALSDCVDACVMKGFGRVRP